jgi:hypothetical protein
MQDNCYNTRRCSLNYLQAQAMFSPITLVPSLYTSCG